MGHHCWLQKSHFLSFYLELRNQLLQIKTNIHQPTTILMTTQVTHLFFISFGLCLLLCEQLELFYQKTVFIPNQRIKKKITKLLTLFNGSRGVTRRNDQKHEAFLVITRTKSLKYFFVLRPEKKGLITK